MAGGTIRPRRTAIFEPPAVFVQGGRVKEVILTSEGYEKLKDEIEYLSNDRRREVAERIRVAREFGDIAENAEYDNGKDGAGPPRGAHRHARGAATRTPASSRRRRSRRARVSIGTTVRLRDVGANKTIEYRIVGSAEADPTENKLSNESPVGKAIMGRKKGETVEVAAPRGKLKFKIMDIKAA